MFHSFSTINALFTKLRNFLSLFWSLKLIITLITTQLNFKNSSRLQFFKIVLDLRDQRVGANLLLPPANEVWGKVIFLHLSVILFTGRVPGQVHLPPGTPPARYHSASTPRDQCMLGDTGNKRAVRILLECILIWHIFCQKLHEKMDWGTSPRSATAIASNCVKIKIKAIETILWSMA